VPQNVLAAFKSHDAGGVSYVNTLAVGQDVPLGPDTALDYGTIADDIWTWLGTEYKALMNPNYTVDELHVLGILGGDGEGTHSVGAVGTLDLSGASSLFLPKELALVLTLKTAHAGRTGRGRMFIPSPLSASFGNGATNWLQSGAYWTAIGAFATKILAGADITHGALVHHYTGKVWSRTEATARAITATTRRAPYHFLRSRSTAP